MRIGDRPESGHLTYCTNIHAGEALDQVMTSLAHYLPAIRAQVAGDEPMGVGLRLGHAAAEGLAELNPVRIRWWLIVSPCVLLAATLLALNFVGESLREAMDPKRAPR